MDVNTFEKVADGTIAEFSAIGFLINIMSISYFTKSEKNELANKLMICLNFTELLTSITIILICIYRLGLYIKLDEHVAGTDASVQAQKLVTAVFIITFTSS